MSIIMLSLINAFLKKISSANLVWKLLKKSWERLSGVKNHTLNPMFDTTLYQRFNCLIFLLVGLAVLFSKKLSFLEVIDHLKLKHFGNVFVLITLFKVKLSPSKKVYFICFSENPLKTMNS